MSRPTRLVVPTQVHHLVQRGNNKQDIFLEDEDYLFYLKVLKEAIKKYQIAVHSYVLMPNHVHLLVTPRSETAPSQMMQFIGRFYVRYFNAKYNRSGTLWEGRFKASVIDSEAYLFAVSQYIETNPLRAELVTNPVDYQFSSYHDNALGVVDEIITPHIVYLELDNNEQIRLKKYQQIMETGLTQDLLDNIRLTVNKNKVLGDETFIKKIEKIIRRPIVNGNWGGDRRSQHYQETHKDTMRTKVHIYKELVYKQQHA